MNPPALMRILLLEDEDDDAALIMRELERTVMPCTVVRVATGPEYQKALDVSSPDLILSDHRIQGYDGMSALRWALDRCAQTPFVFVSGTISEDVAIGAMRDGATDYVLKDRLSRLGPVVLRVRAEQALRREVAAIREQHIHGQKLQAMGEMASGVAHDFRNILAAMLGHAELLQESLAAGDPGRDRIGTILAAGQHGVELCAQLVAFGRQAPVAPADFDPVVEVRWTEKLFRSVLTSSVTMSIESRNGAGWVHADPGQFRQVMMNLLGNARDAMPDGGSLNVMINARDLVEPKTCVASVAVPGAYVEIAVTDTGCGMSEERRTRIFEPYFTTKTAGRGTGLGLAIVFGIIRNAGGHILVDTQPGVGTTMRILLPRVTAPSGTLIPAVDLPKIRMTILVADDDPAFREQIRQVLQLAGFVVLLAADGVEVLEIAGRHPDPIALLLTDLHMPRMGGWELTEEFTKVRPGSRIMVMTGGAESEDGSRGPSPYPILRKPFAPGVLLIRIFEILGTTA